MLKQMKAKSDGKNESKEGERKRATEKYKYFFFLRIEQGSDKNGRFQKEEIEKRRQMEKGRHLEQHQ